MLEKGKFLRKLLCLWGWHHWTKHDKQKEDRAYRLILPGVAIFFSLLFLALNIVFPQEPIVYTTFVTWTLILLIGLATLPKAMRLAGGAFDGTCVFCHKHVMHLTEERNKKKDDEEYLAALTEVAKEAYENNVGDVK